MKYSSSVALAFLAALLFAGSARAVDGTIDINQAKVLAAGGFPYDVSNSGSYRLTGNLTVSSPRAGAIILESSNTTLDLNGFSIAGPGLDLSMTTGVSAPGASTNVVVKNGAVTGFEVDLSLGTDARAENVSANSNHEGILVGDRSTVRNCATNSGDFGIVCAGGAACTFTGNTVASNNFDGIQCGNGYCVISNNTINANGQRGVVCVAPGCLILNNLISNNGTGIQANFLTTGYANNALNGNTTTVTGGTSLGAGNTNLCNGTRC